MNKNKVEEHLAELSNILHEDVAIAHTLFEEIKKYFNEEEQAQIKLAFECANDYHRGQKRKSGEPYIIHPVSVALIGLREMHLIDVDATIAALLHDVIEDTKATKEMLTMLFGEEVANLVDGVSKIKDLNHMSKDEEAQVNDCKLLRMCANDIREIIIKIDDRLHNMRTLIYKGSKEQIEAYNDLPNKETGIEEMVIHPNAKQIEKSAETYALFVPLADRIGASLVRDELLNISFMYLQNEAFRTIKKGLAELKEKSEPSITKLMLQLSELLEKAQIEHDMKIDYKKPFDAYTILKRRKLKVKDIPSIEDIATCEINVENKAICYQVIELLQKKFGVPNEQIEDYIKTPKSNGYRAVHMHVTLPTGYQVCIKVCSKRMKLINDYGLAILTELYPEKTMQEIQNELNKSNAFIAALQSIEKLSSTNASFLRHVREELLSKQIEVISKDQERISLPRGATVLDFAYKIHTKIGDQATGALVNGFQAPLNHVLNDGDHVIVFANETQLCQPREYAEFVKTYTARKKIKEGSNKAEKLIRERKKDSGF